MSSHHYKLLYNLMNKKLKFSIKDKLIRKFEFSDLNKNVFFNSNLQSEYYRLIVSSYLNLSFRKTINSFRTKKIRENLSFNNNVESITVEEFKSSSTTKEYIKLLSIPLGVLLLKQLLDEEESIKCSTETATDTSDSDILKPIVKPYLGCSIRQNELGMQVILIKSNSPAEKSGLQMKDIITEIDGVKVANIHDYNIAVGFKKGIKKLFVLRNVDGKSENEKLEILVDFD